MKNLFAILLLSFLFLSARATEPAVLFDSANKAYEKGSFEEAARQYEVLLAEGYEAPEVYFNLGNAYFKTDRLALSILNYERARKLMPNDQDLIFNLKLANQRTLDKVEPLPRLFLDEWWDTLTGMHSESTWGIRSIISFCIFLFFLGLFLTSGKLFTKQLGFWLGLVFLAFSVFSFFISRSSHVSLTLKDAAIILSSSVEVKNAPSSTGKKLFMLHEGTRVETPQTILNEEGEWILVKLSDEKAGWVKRSALEFI